MSKRSPFKTIAFPIVLVLAALLLAACNPADFANLDERHLTPLSNGTKFRLKRKDMDASAPMVVRIFKEEATLEVWKRQNSSGRFALYKSYEICSYSGVLGPKLQEGDRQAPEGFYTISPGLMNPKSQYHLAFNLGYPNAFDRAHGRTGAHLMVHGSCSSRGCYAMEDEQIEEIYQLAREAFDAGHPSFQVQAFPFRMTNENIAKHASSPHAGFWKTLKLGSDHFEAMNWPPKVDVCGKNYIFNAVAEDGKIFDAVAACPAYSVPDYIKTAVAEHRGEKAPVSASTATAPSPVAVAALGNKLPPAKPAAASTAVATTTALPTTTPTQPAAATNGNVFSRWIKRN